jgi:hypothetical protein
MHSVVEKTRKIDTLSCLTIYAFITHLTRLIRNRQLCSIAELLVTLLSDDAGITSLC